MREIKFRIWLPSIKKMTAGGTLEDILSWGVRTREVNIWLQYIGLKDKNGQEIYEGDILEINSLYKDVIERYEVLWEGYGFAVRKRLTLKDGKEIKKKAVLVNRLSIRNHSEIIGNIYENPELLEGE